MRKFLYVLLGLLLVAGAAGTFGVRQLGWDGGSFLSSRHDRAPSFERSEGRRAFSADRHEPGGGGRGGRGFSFATVLDVLNVVVGIIGIVLTISGLRMQRHAMQMTMRGKD